MAQQGEHRRGGGNSMVSGKVVSTDKEIIDFATIYLKGAYRGCTTDEKGVYHIRAAAGKYTLVVSAIGYKTQEKAVTLTAGGRLQMDITLVPSVKELGEVVVISSGVSRINRSAFNAVAIDATALHSMTQNLSDALAKVPGVKLRASGGLGSDTKLSIDGFSGNHVKVFIDGVPQDGVGSSFGLNNIPVNFAERIEVYRGVVPVGFGTDALGGVVNIVTNNKRRTYVDASYSYGSFNTHRTYLSFGHTTKKGFMFDLNFFQNYSDNDYYVDVPVEDFNTGVWDTDKKEHVKRFHDMYHNESAIVKIGVKDKPYADRLAFSFTYSQEYKEIQNGVIQSVVYGQKFRKGHSFMPALEYRKRNLLKGLDVLLTANYNRNLTQNVDTSAYRYNWRGERKYVGTLGEQAYQNSEFDSNNWNGTFTLNYHLGEHHAFVLNHTITGFTRPAYASSPAEAGADTVTNSSMLGKTSLKNITGLSYRYSMGETWNVSVFGKYYNQSSSGPKSTSASTASYVKSRTSVSTFGYGLATTYFFFRDLQAKFSYEKAVRLPTTDELFGDEDLELGTVDLKPERSHNVNVSLSYNFNRKKHSLYVEGGFIYRDTRDYIMRTTPKYSGGVYYGSQSNHGRVRGLGFSADLRYNYFDWLSLGGNLTNLNSRNYERYVEAGSSRESTTYKERIPNTPYLFSNADVSFFWHDCLGKGNMLTVTYENNYVHSFTLDWANQGDYDVSGVPTQFSHNLRLLYNWKKAHVDFSF
ncbi:MAG: carboxypeptidase-like regulatory domain-containing protein, partial [Paraprevotella sp.]|nr:carboxypeptidase-like regulatory domain-containing protein [Paraprevotella sp.]